MTDFRDLAIQTQKVLTVFHYHENSLEKQFEKAKEFEKYFINIIDEEENKGEKFVLNFIHANMFRNDFDFDEKVDWLKILNDYCNYKIKMSNFECEFLSLENDFDSYYKFFKNIVRNEEYLHPNTQYLISIKESEDV